MLRPRCRSFLIIMVARRGYKRTRYGRSRASPTLGSTVQSLVSAAAPHLRRTAVQAAERAIRSAVGRPSSSLSSSGTRVSTSYANTVRRAGRARSTTLTGYSGRLTAVKKPAKRKLKPPTYSKAGSRLVIESGGILADPDTVYLGHATFVSNDMLNSLARAIVRKLFIKAGMDLRHWDEDLPTIISGYIWGIRIYRNSKGADSVASVNDFVERTVPIGSTYYELANQVNQMLRVEFPNSDQELKQMELKTYTGSPLDQQQDTVAKINGGNSKINFQIESVLKVQNITQAQGAAAGDDTIDQLGANPVAGTYFLGRGNGFQDRAQIRANQPGGSLSTSSLKKGWTASTGRKGIIENKASDGNLYTKAVMKGTDFNNVSGSKACQMSPSEMKYSKLYSSMTMTIDGFLNLFRKDIIVSPSITESIYPYHRHGKCAMFGLRKALDMGVEENNVRIGWQLVYKIGSYLTTNATNVAPDIVQT